jgi:hypothetical protein
MGKRKPDEQTDLDLLHEWLAATGGSIELGATTLRSAETSKSGNKLTIVLKKSKPEKKPVAVDNDA